MKSLNELMEQFNQNSGTDTENINLEEKRVEWYNAEVGDLDKIDGYNCNLCKNKGFIARLSETGSEVHTFCKCRKIRAVLRQAERSGLKNILSDYTFDKYETTEEWQKFIKTKAQTFCKDDIANWFFIGGQVGSGKTMICTAIAGYYIKAGYEVKYMLWNEESKRLKAIANDVSYQEQINTYKTVDVLYIDDFLKTKNGENPTVADINLAFEIINHRLIEGDKITIISSEKTLDEMLDYDEATMSRIYQKTGAYKFNIGKDKSKNYRLRDNTYL